MPAEVRQILPPTLFDLSYLRANTSRGALVRHIDIADWAEGVVQMRLHWADMQGSQFVRLFHDTNAFTLADPNENWDVQTSSSTLLTIAAGVTLPYIATAVLPANFYGLNRLKLTGFQTTLDDVTFQFVCSLNLVLRRSE